ncbi:hypothetical protein, partial [Nonomuraea cypriaca]|uniref:hypothetical protein n=1 Tax=Nonomuraea cypriaca TaxID=1187855 RepID=UPI001F29A686
TRTTKKPVANARLSVLEIDLFAGPGQNEADGCLMPPVHFQSNVESTKREIWVSYAWLVDGKTVDSSKSWVSADSYTMFVTSGQYMLDAGRHTVTLRATSPSAAQRSTSFSVCAMETW